MVHSMLVLDQLKKYPGRIRNDSKTLARNSTAHVPTDFGQEYWRACQLLVV